MKYKTEKRKVQCEKRIIKYNLTRKPVKNINLRIKPDGRIFVSANNKVPVDYIDGFIRKKQDYIISALDRYERNKNQAQDYTRRYVSPEILDQICRETYNKFKKYGVVYPDIKIRDMKTRWGSCRPYKSSITLNSRLLELPRNCIEYVVLHEFAHFIHPNHSKEFYEFIEMLMPDWKERKQEIKKYEI